MSWTPEPKRALTFARLKKFLQEHKASNDLHVNNISDSLCLRRDFFTSSKNNLVISTASNKKGTYVWQYSVGSGSYDSDQVIIEPDIKYRYEVKVIRKTGVTSTGTTTTAVIAGKKYTVPSFSPQEGYRLDTITYKKCDGTIGTTSSGSKLTINCDTTITVTAVKQYNITVITESGTEYGGEVVNNIVATVDTGSSWNSDTFTTTGQGTLNIVTTPVDNVTINNGVVSISSVEDDYTIISSTQEIVVSQYNITIITDGNSYYQGQSFPSQSPYVTVQLNQGTNWDSGNNAVSTDPGYQINKITISPTLPSSRFIYDSSNKKITVKNIRNNYTITITSKLITPTGDPDAIEIIGTGCLDPNIEPELGVNFQIVDSNDNEVDYQFVEKSSKNSLTNKGDYFVEWDEGTEDSQTGVYHNPGYTVYLKWESSELLSLSGLCVGDYVGYGATVKPAPMYSWVTDVGLGLVSQNFIPYEGSGQFSFTIGPNQTHFGNEAILSSIKIQTDNTSGNTKNIDINAYSLANSISGQLTDGTAYQLTVQSPYECSILVSNVKRRIIIEGTVANGTSGWWNGDIHCEHISSVNIIKKYWADCAQYADVTQDSPISVNLSNYIGSQSGDNRSVLINTYPNSGLDSIILDNYTVDGIQYNFTQFTINCESGSTNEWWEACSNCSIDVDYENEREANTSYGIINEMYGTVYNATDTPSDYNVTGQSCIPLEQVLSRGSRCYPNDLRVSNIISIMDSNFENNCDFCSSGFKMSAYTFELYPYEQNVSIAIDGQSVTLPCTIDPDTFIGEGVISHEDSKKIQSVRVKVVCAESSSPPSPVRPGKTCQYITNITPHFTGTQGAPSLGLYSVTNPKNVSFTATIHTEYDGGSSVNSPIDLFSYCTYSATPQGDGTYRIIVTANEQWKLDNCNAQPTTTLYNNIVDFRQL